ncbi:peptidase C1 [Liberibacter crescens]|nr:peptidase C1 [Liberibacter crescens]
MPKYSTGLQPSIYDSRDFYYSSPSSISMDLLPPKVDNTPAFPVYDQGELNSCTANAFAAAIQYDRMKHWAKKDFIPSRLFIYYNERSLENRISYDSGIVTLRDGILTLYKQGVCPESEWTYDYTYGDKTTGLFPADSKAVTKPPETAYQHALAYRIARYERLPLQLSQLKACLAAGHVFVIGFAIFESWFAGENGTPLVVMPVPLVTDTTRTNHAVVVTGYDDETQLFKIRNSWGDNVGEKGHFYIPYICFLDPNIIFEVWVIYNVLS